MPTPLSPLDANFLNVDTEITRQVIACFSPLATLPDFSLLTRTFREVLPCFPRLRQKIVFLPKPNWVEDETFDLANHLELRCLPEMRSAQDLIAVITREFSHGLPLARPPWRFVIFTNISPRAEPHQHLSVNGLLYSFHHAFADGLGARAVLNAVCTSENSKPLSNSEKLVAKIASEENSYDAKEFPRQTNTTENSLSLNEASSVKGGARLKILRWIFAQLQKRRGPSPLNGPKSSQRNIALIQLSLPALRVQKRRLGVTVNDLLLAMVTGAVRRYHSLSNFPTKDLRILIPLSTRMPTAKTDLGNHFTGVGVTLPVSLEDANAQLQAIHCSMTEIKSDVLLNAYIFAANFISKLPRFLQRWLSQRLAKGTNFICTNMPLSAERTQYLAGAKIEGHYPLAALLQEQGVAFGFITYAQKVCVGLITDPRIVSTPERLIQCFDEAVDEVLGLSPMVHEARREVGQYSRVHNSLWG